LDSKLLLLVHEEEPQKEGKNMSLSKRFLLLGSILFTTTFLLALSAITPANAATTARTTALINTASCNFTGATKIYDKPLQHGNETRHIQLWYSQGSRCVWAEETNGQPGDIVWVWNLDTHAQSSVTSNGHTAATGEINDAGTQSHACMVPLYSNGTYGPKTCTGYY
jgi:hypothetical protein